MNNNSIPKRLKNPEQSIYFRRLAACLIDCAIYCIAAFALMISCFATHSVDSAGNIAIGKLGKINAVRGTFWLAWASIMCKDILGIGKLIMGLSVVSMYSGIKASLWQRVIRNFTIFLWPAEIYLLMQTNGRQRLGDRMLNIAVVRK